MSSQPGICQCTGNRISHFIFPCICKLPSLQRTGDLGVKCAPVYGTTPRYCFSLVKPAGSIRACARTIIRACRPHLSASPPPPPVCTCPSCALVQRWLPQPKAREMTSQTRKDVPHGPDEAQGSLVSQWSCFNCRKRKARCNRQKPCAFCSRAGVECCYPFTGRMPTRQHNPAAGNSASVPTASARKKAEPGCRSFSVALSSLSAW